MGRTYSVTHLAPDNVCSDKGSFRKMQIRSTAALVAHYFVLENHPLLYPRLEHYV